jgi:hypothetical protein
MKTTTTDNYRELDQRVNNATLNLQIIGQELDKAERRWKDACEKTSKPSIALTTLKGKDHPRQSRWDAINAVTVSKRTKTFDAVAYSNVSWPLLKTIYAKEMEDYIQEYDTRALNVENVVIALTYLELCRVSLRHMLTGQEARRVHLIMPILVCVCASFDGDVKILIEEDVFGERVRVRVHFEFVLERKGKKVCVVEAKMDDFDQGLAQNLLGCDAVADVEDADVVYGIVTNYLDWIFIRSCNRRIFRDDCCLNFDKETKAPTNDSVLLTAGKIHAMLKDNDESVESLNNVE